MEFDIRIFGAGLGVGMLIALSVWVNKWRSGAASRKQMEELKQHLQTQMSITAKGYEELQQELKRLKQENENLRVTVSTLSNKPGRAELKTLQIWDKALRLMIVNSPGFAPAWEVALNEASKDMQDTETGVKALVRKVFPMLPQELSLGSGDETSSIDRVS
ncbi:MAG: hypothetical protein MUF72_14720 [Elainella sp. Prado103]|jgi:hypothetical protein|nr:hypothetical protein [Elainella sp. Prado103]